MSTEMNNKRIVLDGVLLSSTNTSSLDSVDTRKDRLERYRYLLKRIGRRSIGFDDHLSVVLSLHVRCFFIKSMELLLSHQLLSSRRNSCHSVSTE